MVNAETYYNSTLHCTSRHLAVMVMVDTGKYDPIFTEPSTRLREEFPVLYRHHEELCCDAVS